ncbi:MAG TPA: tyrosine-type recombinase/integrase [Candidatus Acidoferrales bacterium]|nr:tyrosine-type recombinase/integrase [Candidatus Acidoferrales bacterium]
MIYKRGRYYWFKFSWKGQQLYFSTEQSNADVARRLESKKRTELAEGRELDKKKEAPILRRYLHDTIIPWAEAQFVAVPNSLKWYRNEARVLCDYPPLADVPLDHIKESLVGGFKSWRLKQGKAIATVNSTIRVLRSALAHAVDDELLDVVPKLKVLKRANIRKWVLLSEQEQSYLNACTEPLRTVAAIIIDAGLRPDGCFRLRWENVRFVDAKRAVLVVPGTKTIAAARPVPMTPRVRDILESRWQQASRPATGWVFPAKRARVGHIVDNTIYEPHLNAVEEIKLNPREFVIYALRHTCLTRWGNSGMDAWTLARLAGHSNIRQSM